jgi:MFS family permease
VAGRLSDSIGFKTPIYAGLAVMLLSVLFISTFAAGASPYLVAVGMLGVGAGFRPHQLPERERGRGGAERGGYRGGPGIFNGLFFLGGGTGPAVVGAFLAARREAGAGALNPLYMLDAAPFSDAFLLLVVGLFICLLVSLGIRSPGTKAHAPEKGGR